MFSFLRLSSSHFVYTKTFLGPLFKNFTGKFKGIPWCSAKYFNSTAIDVPADLADLHDGSLTTPQIIQKYGYNTEVYYVTTRDGYTLQLHRIPKIGGEPFLLQHGLIDSSAGFVFSGSKMALSFYLSDLGYDVWLGNTRGNRYAQEHFIFDPIENKKEFWNFHLNEIGRYDLTATIDYVLSRTKTETLNYVGHGTGTTIFWIMCSMFPEYNQKIKLMHALAPIAYVEHITETLKNFLKCYYKNPETYNITPPSTTSNGLIRLDGEFTKVCLDFLFAVCGPNKSQLIPQMLPTIFGHMPAGCSSNQIEHLLQMSDSKRFCNFDFGIEENQLKYENKEPPAYNLKNTTCPTILYYSKNDRLATPKDVEHLKLELGNCQGKLLVKSESWTHYDFMFGKESRELVYELLVKNTEDFETGLYEKTFDD